MRKKKPKKTNRIKLACTLIQLYARLRDTDINGNGRCCSCQRPLQWGDGNGGHWHPKTRGFNAACVMTENVNLQCPKCNLFSQGEIASYTEYMMYTYGKTVISMIAARSHRVLDKQEIEEKIVELRKLCEELAKEKNFKVKVP